MSRTLHSTNARARLLLVAGLSAAVGIGTSAGCTGARPVLTRQIEARRLTAELRLEFSRAVEAANRAVMADSDQASATAGDESRRARQIVERNVETLRILLGSLGYSEDADHLNAFASRYEEYRRIDDELLPLAAENSNLKAQRLSFGPSREAARAFNHALDEALKAGGSDNPARHQVAAARARIAVLEIQALYAQHIAEAEDGPMTDMEQQMASSAGHARAAMDELRRSLSRAAEPLDAAAAALNRFMSIHTEIIALSRRNSEVRSLALSLGRKRVVIAECEAHLQALEAALAKHEFTATR
jgi:hypothetical protein